MSKIAVVTGAGGGIGRAVALRLAQDGMKLVIVDLKEEDLHETAGLIEQAGGTVTLRNADVSDEAAVRAYMELAVQTYGGLDVVAHCAAIIQQYTPIEDTSVEDADRVFRVNLLGTFIALKQALRIMKPNGKGVIICTGSTNSLLGCPGLGVYSGSKHGVLGLVKSAAGENGHNGVRVCCVIPGNTNTDMIAAFRDVADQSAGPMRRVARPSEVAECFSFLAGDRASYTNASIMVANGGLGCCTM